MLYLPCLARGITGLHARDVDSAVMPCPPVGLQPHLGAGCEDTAFATTSTKAQSILHHVMILNII